MTYATDFEGEFTISPPLSPPLRERLSAFFANPAADLASGFTKLHGTVATTASSSSTGGKSKHSSTTCPLRLRPIPDSNVIEWNPHCQSANGIVEYLEHVVAVFLSPNGHVARGVMRAQGEDFDDQWVIHASPSSSSSAPLVAGGGARRTPTTTVVTVKRFEEEEGGTDPLNHRVASTWLKPLSEKNDYLAVKRRVEETQAKQKPSSKKRVAAPPQATEKKRVREPKEVRELDLGRDLVDASCALMPLWRDGTLEKRASANNLRQFCKLAHMSAGGSKKDLLERVAEYFEDVEG